MKCSSRRNCDPKRRLRWTRARSLNEVQFPKELRRHARCAGTRLAARRLNEVQFPKELRRSTDGDAGTRVFKPQ